MTGEASWNTAIEHSAPVMRPVRRHWRTVSFPSTLHLHPVIDILLAQIPAEHQAELRLGLQEALVNAAKHGNHLDPCKSVSVRYSCSSREHYWIIQDEGSGFSPPSDNVEELLNDLPCESQSCGRGLFILNQIFDEVCWNDDGTSLTLYKRHQSNRALSFAECAKRGVKAAVR